MDNGYARHMIGDYSWSSSFTKVENGGDVSFRDSLEKKIIGVGNVCKNSYTFIENVCLFNNLKHNFLSISQLSDKGYKVIFDKSNQNMLLRAHVMVKLSFLEKDAWMCAPLR